MLLICSYPLWAVKPCKMQDTVVTGGVTGKSFLEWTTNSGGCCAPSVGSAIRVQNFYANGNLIASFVDYIPISQAQSEYGCDQM